MDERIALITGITGQDGPYLAEFLLARGYTVHGATRRNVAETGLRVAELTARHAADGRFHLHRCDIADSDMVTTLLHRVRPTEIYNLAAQSNVPRSFEEPERTGDVNGLGAARLLEGIRRLDLAARTRFYQASSSELFGNVADPSQNEATSFQPESPYAAAKLYAYWMTVTYRRAMGLHASNGILFNPESPYRPAAFVSRKIARAAAAAALGRPAPLAMGNLDVHRDWGHARDYVEGMWLMLQQEAADDYVLATGETHSVREFVERAFAHAGRDLDWRGDGLAETGIDRASGETLVVIDPAFLRRAEIFRRCGDPAKAHDRLGWRHRTSFAELVGEMVEHDVTLLRREAALPVDAGE